MTAPDAPPPSASPAGREGLGGWLVALLALIGIALLLPGLCSVFFMVAFLSGRGGGSVGSLGALWLITFVVAGGGIWLIAWAIRRR